METAPHEYQIIKTADIPTLKRLFGEEIDKSLFAQKGRKIVLDTTDKTPKESLDELLLLSEPLITFGELAIRAMPVPDVPLPRRLRKWRSEDAPNCLNSGRASVHASFCTNTRSVGFIHIWSNQTNLTGYPSE